MSYLVLSINAGSSSLKTTLFQVHEDDKKLNRLGAAEVAAIGQEKSTLKYTRGKHKSNDDIGQVENHEKAFENVLKAFEEDHDLVGFKDRKELKYACHRVVHGGDFSENQLITQDTFHKIEALSDLAPLHNASAVSLMKACHEQLPKVTNIACFDSAFHQTMPDCVKTYAINPKTAKDKGLRKYGFHGISYLSILRQVAVHLGKPTSETSIIALHLGSGASACAIRKGQSVDTTMGLTPVSGLPGGSRSGDIDPSLVFHYTSDVSKLSPSSTKELHISKAEEILNKQSGWKALTGTSDFGDIAKADAPDTHKLALDIFVDRISGFVGNYYVKLGGQVDAIVFAGGIGEKSALLRKMVIEKCACLGFSLDSHQNDHLPDEAVVEIGRTEQSRTLVCQTDEDYEMAYSMVHSKQG